MRRIIAALSLAAAAIAAVLFLIPRPRHPLQPFVEATSEWKERPFDARLSGGFPYRPLAPKVRGPSASEPVPLSRWKLIAAAAELHDQAVQEATPDTLHAFGVTQIALRHPAPAVETLEEALSRETNQRDVASAIARSADPALLSDLAVAYFARSQTAHHARDLIAAGECAARAVRLDPKNEEAAWNCAVVLEAIGVPDAARAAWTDYLSLDLGSNWAVEARSRLGVLNAPALAQRWDGERQLLLAAAAAGKREMVAILVERYPEQARMLVEEDLLGQWGESRVAATLTAAALIADVVARVSNDTMARDATAIAARVSGSAAEDLARGHRDYLAARRLFRAGRHPEAEPLLASAVAELERGGSPLAIRADVYDITAKHYLGRQEEALAQGRAILRRMGNATVSYPTAAGQARWTCGLVAMALGSLDEALEHHRAALASFRKTQETSNLAGLTLVISSDYRAVGDLDNAWLYQLQSFALASRYASVERAQVVFGGGAVTALRDGYPTFAEEVQRGVLARARTSRQPIFICDALIRQGEMLAALGAEREAREAVAEAMKEWSPIAETAIKSRLRADLEMVRATMSADLPPRERIAQLDSALEAVAKSNSRSRVAKVMLLRARAHRDAGNDTASERDLAAGIAEVEAQREKTSSDETRLTFLNTAADLYDEAMRLHLRRGEDAAALDVLERRRARWLLDRFAPNGSADTSPLMLGDDLRRQIPAGVAVVSYAVAERVDAWVLTAASLEHFVLPRTRDAIAGDVAEWRDAMTTRAAAARQDRLSAALHDSLIGPLRASLGGVHALVIVPDRVLNTVPFAALLDRGSGRHLIEDFTLAVAPSANLYLRCLSREGAVAKGNSALIVANPATGDDESLGSLSGADAEGSAIAAILSSPTVLRGTEATVEHFVSAAADASYIHFAGHAMVNPLRPELSSLVLAPNREGGGSRLYARDVYRLRLPCTRLVVLAACNSAGGRMDGESPLTLATSFIAAGAPAAVASLWPVEDAASSAFFSRVYRNLRGGMSPTDALRDAQIRSLRSGNKSDSTWAAYQLIGGARM
jgi:CHAT domain-containing protein